MWKNHYCNVWCLPFIQVFSSSEFIYCLIMHCLFPWEMKCSNFRVLDTFSLFVSAYTIVDYKLEQYFSLIPNQPVVLLAYNPRSFQPKRTDWLALGIYPVFRFQFFKSIIHGRHWSITLVICWLLLTVRRLENLATEIFRFRACQYIHIYYTINKLLTLKFVWDHF